MPDQPQSFASHSRYVPGFHYVLSGILLVYLVFALVQLARVPSAATGMGALLAVGLVLMGWYERAFAVAVQDRVIRLEEQLRYERLLPADLKSRTAALTKRQMISLRFAHDDELPDLVRQTLEKNLDGTAIKQSIKTWRADHQRV